MKPKAVRIVPWLLLVVIAFAAGRWQAGGGRSSPASLPSPEGSSKPAAESIPAESPRARLERLAAETDALAEAAKSMPTPDGRTYAFFENLQPGDIAPVVTAIEAMPASNEQDALFALAIRRWGELDGAAAVEHAARFPTLAMRVSAQLTAYSAWAAHDARPALAHALRQTPAPAQARALGACLAGAATTDPAAAVSLWQSAPAAFRDSPAGLATASQIASAACGTGKRETLQTLAAALPAGSLRDQLVETIVREWGARLPDQAYRWLQSVVPAGEDRENLVNAMFTELARNDPAMAASWAAAYPDERRQGGYIAAAVAEWAQLDSDAAETWVNEQPSSRALDGASYAIASHFMAQRDLPRSFAWIRRIVQPEARSDMLGSLGRVWSQERPEEFRKFLDETSLNPAEVKMLLAKLGPGP